MSFVNEENKRWESFVLLYEGPSGSAWIKPMLYMHQKE